MSLLKLAAESRVPLISVTTKDIVNIKNNLTDIIQTKIYEYKNGLKVYPNRVYFYYSAKLQLTALEYLYSELIANESCIIVVNPEEPNDIFYVAGVLSPPKESVYNYLCEFMSPKDAKKLQPSLGGLSLKEIGEVLMITGQRDPALSPEGILKTRKYYLQKIKGLAMVDTTMSSYLPDSRLKDYATKQKMFFLNNIDERLTPKGVIAYGVAGTGKSAGAKYLANQWGVPLYRLDAGVQSKYVGESEKNISAALAHLELESPCILLLDEVEKIFGQTNDGTNVTQKMLGTLLWWLQEHRGSVLVYMTCNNISAVPPELYRSGRVDEKFEFKGLPLEKGLKLALHILKSFKFSNEKLEKMVRISVKKKYKTNKTLTQATLDSVVKSCVKEWYLAKKGN